MKAEMQMADTRPTGKKGVSWRPAWAFKGPTQEILSEILEGVEGEIVHVCCGPSTIPGETLRVDLEHPSADLRIDAADLDKHVQGAAAVFLDPPYAWDLGQRQRVHCAAWRSLRVGGLMITHAPWLPRVISGELVRFMFREDPRFHWPLPPVLLSVWKKDSDFSDKHDAEMERRGRTMPKRPEAAMWQPRCKEGDRAQAKQEKNA